MDKVQNPVATIEMADGGVITIELDLQAAPNTVKNFIALVKNSFYDNLIFHRAIPGFMLQGGCPQGSGMSGPGYTIKGEFSKNGFSNPIMHKRGVISMARTADPNSAGSQFFIMVADSPHLDGQYAAFGKVGGGMDVVDRIVAVKRDYADKPLEEQQIKRISVETFGVDYGQPEKLEKS